MDKLSLFFDRIKELSFWQRVFSWSPIRNLSYEAYEQFKLAESKINSQQDDLDVRKNKITRLETEKEGSEQEVQYLKNTILTKDNQINNLTDKLKESKNQTDGLRNKVSRFEATEETRQSNYENKITQLNEVRTGLVDDRTRLNDKRLKEKQDQFDRMKGQWTEHETAVEQKIKQLCQTHLINYKEKVPFKGNPDNAIEICDEYIIFDAKSPANEDLTNFPKYIKAQTDNVKKYANQESVRKDIFLVIPSNTIETISQLTYNMGDYNVYVITIDSLEPIILSLKKIEEYEFAEQLSPEERDNICRVIGKFAHTTKRKIQIDQFFANQFIELLVKCKNDLPEDLLKSVIEFEKAEKLNPPTERRAKQILTKDLQEKNDSINAEAQIRDIAIPNSFDEVKKLD